MWFVGRGWTRVTLQSTELAPLLVRALSAARAPHAKSRLAQIAEDDRETLRRLQARVRKKTASGIGAGAGHAVAAGTRQTDAMQQMAETQIQEALNQVRLEIVFWSVCMLCGVEKSKCFT